RELTPARCLCLTASGSPRELRAPAFHAGGLRSERGQSGSIHDPSDRVNPASRGAGGRTARPCSTRNPRAVLYMARSDSRRAGSDTRTADLTDTPASLGLAPAGHNTVRPATVR